jgi:Tfp pilus assembly protein PilO
MLLPKISIPILVAGSLILGAAGAAKVAGRDQEKLEHTAKDVEKLKAQRVDDALELREVHTELRDVAKGVDRLESRLGTK